MTGTTTATTFMPATGEVKVSEVSREFSELMQSIARLREVTATLEKALEPVCRQVNGTEGSGTNAPEPVRVPLAQTVHEHSDEVDRIASQLQSILSRLEL